MTHTSSSPALNVSPEHLTELSTVSWTDGDQVRAPGARQPPPSPPPPHWPDNAESKGSAGSLHVSGQLWTCPCSPECDGRAHPSCCHPSPVPPPPGCPGALPLLLHSHPALRLSPASLFSSPCPHVPPESIQLFPNCPPENINFQRAGLCFQRNLPSLG